MYTNNNHTNSQTTIRNTYETGEILQSLAIVNAILKHSSNQMLRNQANTHRNIILQVVCRDGNKVNREKYITQQQNDSIAWAQHETQLSQIDRELVRAERIYINQYLNNCK